MSKNINWKVFITDTLFSKYSIPAKILKCEIIRGFKKSFNLKFILSYNNI
jgi:hypothetical protein